MENIILQKQWVQGAAVVPDDLRGTAFTGENGAHTFRVTGIDANQDPVAITGTITGKFLAANNVTVPLTGSIDNGAAVLTLTEDCYAVPGRFIVSIFATNDDTTLCIYCGVGNVFRTESSIVAYPSASIPDIQELIDEAQAVSAQVPGIVSAAQTAVDGIEAQKDTMIASIASVAGQGTDTTLTQSGVAADAKAAGDQIGNLKSAIDESAKTINWDGTAHSSTLDKVGFSAKNGDVIYFTVYYTGTLSIQLFGYSGSTGTKLMENPKSGVRYLIKITSTYDAFSLYIATGSAQTIVFKIEGENSPLSMAKTYYSKISGEYVDIDFAGGTHGGTLDKIPFISTAGQSIAFVPFFSVKPVGLQIFGFRPNGTYDKIADYTPSNGIPKTFQTSYDYNNYGVYFQDSTAQHIRFIITDADSIAGTVGSLKDEYDTKFFASYTHNTPSNIETAIEDYAEYFVDGVHTIEPFLFFTDPHILPGNYAESQYKQNMEKTIGTIQNAYNRTPTSFVLCGGDWLTQDDTMIEAARKLGFVNGIMNSKFNAYYPMLGNHDTNYQGISEEGQSTGTGRLSQASLNTLWFNKFGHKAYYDFKGDNTRFYVFDSGLDSEQNMDAYRWSQVDWFAKSLLENDDPHSVIAIHIFAQPSAADISAGQFTDDPDVQALADNITKIAQAYNSRQSITLNSENYDFTSESLTGKVSFLIAGHTHFDADLVHNDIPVIITAWATWTPTFDLVFVDYDNGKFKTARIGTGSNREIDIIV